MDVEIKEPYGFIYITTNIINGKRYIGQRKFKDYGGKKWSSYLGSGKALIKAIEKYGKENFIRDIVYIAYSKEELDKIEIEFIKNYNAVKDRNYYNIAKGGQGNSLSGESHPNYGKHWSEEDKKKMSVIIKEKYMNGELINPNPKGCNRPEISGENHPNYGKHLSEEVKNKISNSHIGIKHSEETKQKISKINKGKGNPNYGNKWNEEQKQKASDYWKDYWKNISDSEKPMCTKVINLDTLEVFDSINKAKEKYTKGDISACCRRKTKKAGGYRWMYYSEYLKLNDKVS